MSFQREPSRELGGVQLVRGRHDQLVLFPARERGLDAHVGKTRHAAGVDRDAHAARRAQLPKVSDQAVGNIDGRGRATVGEPTRLVEPRRRIRESLTEQAGRFAARQTLECGARRAESPGHVDAIADSRGAASERREGGAEDCRRDRELGSVAQVAAEYVGVRAGHGVGDAVGERIELGAPHVRDRPSRRGRRAGERPSRRDR